MLLLDNYLANPTHEIKIAFVGVGGTGSHLLTELAGFSSTLEKLNRKPLEIHAFDGDKIETHNVNKQKFHEPDIGGYKAEVLVNRINRIYGFNMKYHNRYFDAGDIMHGEYNIIISCVDDVKTRRQIHSGVYRQEQVQKGMRTSSYNNYSYRKLYYWIDCGNGKDFGQVILASFIGDKRLPTIIDLHPDLKDDPHEPSCSVMASLHQQSYNVNKFVGLIALNMLTTLLIDYRLGYSQVYFNLEPFNVKTNSI